MRLVPVPEGTPDVRIKAPRRGAKTGTTGVARGMRCLLLLNPPPMGGAATLAYKTLTLRVRQQL